MRIQGLMADLGCRTYAFRLEAPWKGYKSPIYHSAMLTKTQVDFLAMVGVNGKKFQAIRQHLEKNIAGVYKDMNVS